MLSKNSFFLSAIVGSIVHITVGGPLDCISGPCVTVEGVGELILGMSFYTLFTSESQSNPILTQFQYKAISSQPNANPTQSPPTPGKLQGSWEHTQWSHRTINQFMGIPFGETTAGEHR